MQELDELRDRVAAAAAAEAERRGGVDEDQEWVSGVVDRALEQNEPLQVEILTRITAEDHDLRCRDLADKRGGNGLAEFCGASLGFLPHLGA